MGDELARRLSHFNSIPVSTCNSRFLLEISEVPLSLFICGSSLRLFARNL
jgi:hypothetical protein